MGSPHSAQVPQILISLMSQLLKIIGSADGHVSLPFLEVMMSQLILFYSPILMSKNLIRYRLCINHFKKIGTMFPMSINILISTIVSLVGVATCVL